MPAQQHQRRLVAVVVTYNRVGQLRVTVPQMLAEPEALLHRLIVVDNASTDETAEWLATLDDPRLIVHRCAQNLGGAGGFEAGMRLAVEEHDPDWLLLTDDDGRPAPGALAAFHAVPDDRWDAIAAAVYFPSGEICEMNRPSRNPFWHIPELLRTLLKGRGGFHIPPAAYSGPPMQIDVTSFVGFFISRRGVETAGYPDGRLFLYGDDGLYTFGLSKAGGRIGFEPSIRFDHDLSTFAGQRGRFRPLWKVYYYHRNLLLLYRQAAGIWFWPAFCLILPRWLRKRKDHPGDEAAFMRLLRRAIQDGLSGRIDVAHDEILSLSCSEYPDDSAPKG